MRTSISGRRAVLMIGVVAVAVSAAGYAYGSLTEASPTYTGCLDKGLLTNVAIGDTPLAVCKKGQTQISWSQTGPPGPPGPKGDSASLADTECARSNGDDGAVVPRVRRDDTVELTCETESGHQTLPLTEEVAQVAADFLLSGVRDLELVQDCTGVGACSGGQPVTPAPTVRMTGLDVFVGDRLPGTREFDVISAQVRVETQQPIPISFAGVDCSLTINAGYKPTRVRLRFANNEEPSDPPNRITFSNLTFLERIADDEYSVGGSFLCGVGPSRTAEVNDLILSSIEAQAWGGLCGAPGPDLFMRCTS